MRLWSYSSLLSLEEGVAEGSFLCSMAIHVRNHHDAFILLFDTLIAYSIFVFFIVYFVS